MRRWISATLAATLALSTAYADGLTVPYTLPSGTTTTKGGTLLPTVTTYASGTAQTHTVKTGALWIRVSVKGGGGGGAGTGTASATAGGNGGATSFGASCSSGGGVGGSGVFSDNGASAVGCTLNYRGAPGHAGGTFAIANISIGAGGGQGAGRSVPGGAGDGAATNSGAGGGGGSGGTTFSAGAGGSEGGIGVLLIVSPAASYTYTVGAAGTAGGAGTSGFAGGAGGAGFIVVEEF